MHETKSRLLYILLYLWQNTDAEHYATTGDILTYLKENGISCDRKTIPGDIAKLCDIGIDIEEERSREQPFVYPAGSEAADGRSGVLKVHYGKEKLGACE